MRRGAEPSSRALLVLTPYYKGGIPKRERWGLSYTPKTTAEKNEIERGGSVGERHSILGVERQDMHEKVKTSQRNVHFRFSLFLFFVCKKMVQTRHKMVATLWLVWGGFFFHPFSFVAFFQTSSSFVRLDGV